MSERTNLLITNPIQTGVGSSEPHSGVTCRVSVLLFGMRFLKYEEFLFPIYKTTIGTGREQQIYLFKLLLET